MSVVAIVLIALAALVLAMLAGGYVVARRRAEARDAALLRDVASANEALARARAEDRGWDRDTIDAAARVAHLGHRPDAKIQAVHLVQVVDRPGTEHDEALLRVVDDEGVHDVHLRRRDDVWVPAELAARD